MLSLISSYFWPTILMLTVLLSPATRSWAEDTRQAFPVSRAGQELIGTPAKQWLLDSWLDEPKDSQLTLESLRGQVVLIRFWTATCPYCAASLPALSTFAAQKREQGLVVLGLHHPKPFGTTTSAMTLKKVLKDWQVDIPVGQDSRWQTLKTYWLNERPRPATSVTFLIDRKGIIRWIHPGVEYHPDYKQPGHEQCVQDWRDLVRAVSLLLQTVKN